MAGREAGGDLKADGQEANHQWEREGSTTENQSEECSWTEDDPLQRRHQSHDGRQHKGYSKVAAERLQMGDHCVVFKA